MSAAPSATYSSPANAFDRVATSYDELFTRTEIGRAQRKQVWATLLASFQRGDRVLELNCGTGEDARFLARKGVCVLACDASAAMIEVAASYSTLEEQVGSIEYRQLANEQLFRLSPRVPFDGAFSNFSGLNCVADLQPVARNLASLVRPKARVLICLWSRVCLGEILWFLLHGEVKKAFRRFPGAATARLGESSIAVSYPTIAQVRRAFAPWFRLESRRAIGLFVPPSYAEPWARRNTSTLAWLEKMDRAFSGWPALRDAGDHVLLEFVRCPH
jgi:2-polyprenyl-3-methyl-5-hydroxy-6-metoxy-1,4-benzoquinol methylase